MIWNTSSNKTPPPNSGFIYVASVKKRYYEYALISCQSLKDLYPEANVTLFTHQGWVDDRARNLFDNIVTGIPVHIRAKMWCMARTPYDYTFYNDVDSQIVHPDIKHVFDPLLEHGDMYFCESFPYTAANYRWAYIDKEQKIPAKRHGAVCCYKKTDLAIDFLNTWFEEYLKQTAIKDNEWPYDFAYVQWRQFDMFTLWRLVDSGCSEFERFNNLKIFMGPKRFNCTIHDMGTKKEYGNKPPVVYQIDRSTWSRMNIQHSISKGENDERGFDKEPAIGEYSLKYI